MQRDDGRRRSCWMLRVMEWDDPRARYPNIWHEGMPRQILAFTRLAGRLRLGDLIAVYYPTSTRHPERSDRFLGIARVTGLRRADRSGHAWIDLETAHRFRSPLDVGRMPRRVFMCCDPGWPEADVQIFRAVWDAAVADGWDPAEEETADEDAAAERATEPVPSTSEEASAEPPSPSPPPAPEPVVRSSDERLFAGADYSGDMRDPREGTWLALVGLHEDRLKVLRLDATGRSGLQACLRDPDRDLMDAEAIGLNFPFGLPLPFAESLLGGAFPEEGWWALVRRMERVSWPDYLTTLQEFRDAKGEIMRLADERAEGFSPLHRVDPDMGSRSYHGIRMIAEDRSRYAIRPFESAQGKLLFEVSPGARVKRLDLGNGPGGRKRERERIVTALGRLQHLPLEVGPPFLEACLRSRDALDATIAARCTAIAVLTAEAEKTPEELAPDRGEQVRREGWIYGLQEPS